MLIVHHLNNSRSQRVLWLLEELGVPYEVHLHQRDAQTMLAPPALLAVHPLGKSRWWWRISYGTPSSSSSHSTRCERELLRWWTISMVGLRWGVNVNVPLPRPIHPGLPLGRWPGRR